MSAYAVLVTPAANRVYGRDAPRLAAAELSVALSVPCEVVEIARVPYVVFDAGPLDDDALRWLATSSSAHAVFEMREGRLRPVELPAVERLDDDLVTIQRYPGKTNEQFTRLLLTVTLASGRRRTGRLRILDPVAGRGTTVNTALVLGMDAAGIELERPAFEAYASFLKTWLKDKRLKHSVEEGTVRRAGKIVARRLDVTFARTKDEQKAGDVQTVRFVNDDVRNAGEHFRQEAFDAIVGDLPYGVQHDGRSARELVADAAAVWARLLRHGAALGLAWNVTAVPRDTLASALEAAGLAVRPGAGLEHRVDRAVTRDVIIAVRP